MPCKRGTKVADIYIVGLGILNVDQMTHETERVIRRHIEEEFSVSDSCIVEKQWTRR